MNCATTAAGDAISITNNLYSVETTDREMRPRWARWVHQPKAAVIQ
jgi:hypothetical protein